ncbi:MAG: sterol desaturase family protein, partial [Myxococcales bacterium]|nr:sterol desaturase family protein [Myxococcales bacterium]
MNQHADQTRQYSSEENRTRASRPETKRLGQAFRVFLRYPTPAIISTLFVVSSFVRLVLGRWSAWDLVASAIVVGYWPFQEWFAHKYLLHLKPFRFLGRTIDIYPAARHRAHHQNPSDFSLVFLPWHVPLIAFAAFVGLGYLVFHSFALTMTIMTTFSAVALAYEWIHFITHTDYVPKTAYMRRIWRNHRLHHYKNEHYWFSFTMPAMDEWMGTGGPHDQVEKSE